MTGTPESELQKSFLAATGQEIDLRPPRKGDAPVLLEYINQVIAEDTFVLPAEPLTLEQEEGWLRDTLMQIERNNMVHLCAFEGSRCVGSTSILRKPHRSRHVGEFGIIVARDYRGQGLGRVLMEEIHKRAAATMDLHMTQLMCFATNTRALQIYRDFGYSECGRVPELVQHRGAYVDMIYMFRRMKDGGMA